MNDGMSGSPVLALYITENAPDVFNGREVSTSFQLYRHTDGDAISESQERIRNLLQSTISMDRLIYSPGFSTRNFRRAMERILKKNSDRDYLGAFFFLMDPNLDCKEIQSLEIKGPTSNDYFLFMAKFRNIREATLEPASLFAEPFLYFLKEQDLRTLHINCVMDDCIFKDMRETNPQFRRLRDALQTHCTALRVLTLRCACREHGTEMASHMARLVKQVPHVEKLRIATAADATKELLVELEDMLALGVSLELDVYMDHGEAACLGPRHHFDLVKAVTIKHAGKREIFDLVVFDNIKELDLEFISGGETKLIAVPPENIETLRINASPMAAIGNGILYYELSESALRMAVNHMPNLKDLAIINCRISKIELYEIMEQIGNNLESLEISILDQEECPSQRLLDICVANIKFNTNIRRLKIKDNEEGNIAEVLKWGTETYNTYWLLHQELIHARYLLTRIAFMLDPCYLDDSIQSLIPHPNVIAEVQEIHPDPSISSSVTSDED